MREQILFGGDEHPWRSKDFRAVDDRLRGGSSISHLEVEKLEDGRVVGHFCGHLDTHTLGGAGFASQACTKMFNLGTFDGLRIRCMSEAKQSSKKPSSFTLNVKTEVPARRLDGRNESVIVYEYAFSNNGILTGSGGNDANQPATVKYTAQWKEFSPTYRGRPASDAPQLEPANIQEISIMCRSNFDKQEASLAGGPGSAAGSHLFSQLVEMGGATFDCDLRPG